MEGGLRYSVIPGESGTGRGRFGAWIRPVQPALFILERVIGCFLVGFGVFAVCGKSLYADFRAPNVADLSELGERRSRFLQIPTHRFVQKDRKYGFWGPMVL